MLYEGKVTKVSRLNNSINGNPRYAVWLDRLGRFVTPTDAGWVYGVNFGNLEGRNVLIETGKRTNSRTIEKLTGEA